MRDFLFFPRDFFGEIFLPRPPAGQASGRLRCNHQRHWLALLLSALCSVALGAKKKARAEARASPLVKKKPGPRPGPFSHSL